MTTERKPKLNLTARGNWVICQLILGDDVPFVCDYMEVEGHTVYGVYQTGGYFAVLGKRATPATEDDLAKEANVKSTKRRV